MKKLVFFVLILSLVVLGACKKKQTDSDEKNTNAGKTMSTGEVDMAKPVVPMDAITAMTPPAAMKSAETEQPLQPLSTRLTCVESAVYNIKTSHPLIKSHDVNVEKSIRWNEGFFLEGDPGIAHRFVLLAAFTDKKNVKMQEHRLFLGECVNGTDDLQVKNPQGDQISKYLMEVSVDPKNACGASALQLVQKEYNEGGMRALLLAGPFTWSEQVEDAAKKVTPTQFVGFFVKYGWDEEFREKNKMGQEFRLGVCEKALLSDANRDKIIDLNDMKRFK
ncbi:MAG: hypothetical protein CVU65_16280 [Deltaproteobacteria bacterium HGW-Deltaproteobacteria-22]|jgi:hypothetical protein|nr:MAG: hypothetical protein CVU65_16280 [Deltaproteobacteria bacterium HGW-Deltaproteobacteria-22]